MSVLTAKLDLRKILITALSADLKWTEDIGMNKNMMWAIALKNSICLICFTVLAVIFNEWWIALFAAFFMTSYQTKYQYYRVCDGCGKHSPSADTYNSALDKAIKYGWLHVVDGNQDYCPECQMKNKF